MLISSIRKYKELILFIIVSASIYVYLFLTTQKYEAFLVGITLDGDLRQYLIRFASSFLLLGIIPYITSRVMGYSNKDIGLIWDSRFLRSKFFWIMYAVCMVSIVITGLTNSELNEFYPFSKTILELSIGSNSYYFFLHLLAYLFLYYVPWELLFRGIMIVPLIHHYEHSGLEKGEYWKNPIILALTMFQILPTLLLHISHPFIESISTIPLGFFAAILVIRTRSIFPILIIHASSGILLDTIIYLQS